MSAITSTFRRLSPPVLSPITSSTVGHHLHRTRSPARVTRTVIVAYRLQQLPPTILIASASAWSASPPSRRASARSDSSPRWEATTPVGVGYRLHPGAVGRGERFGQSHRARRIIRGPGRRGGCIRRCRLSPPGTESCRRAISFVHRASGRTRTMVRRPRRHGRRFRKTPPVGALTSIPVPVPPALRSARPPCAVGSTPSGRERNHWSERPCTRRPRRVLILRL